MGLVLVGAFAPSAWAASGKRPLLALLYVVAAPLLIGLIAVVSFIAGTPRPR